MNVVAPGDLVDVAIAITVAELIALLSYHRWTGRGIAPRRLLPNVCAGMFLMLALHAALFGAGGSWLVACLACAGIAHAVDLWLRWSTD